MTELGVEWTRSVVANIESGRREDVTVGELFALAIVFGVSPLALLIPNSPGEFAVTPQQATDVALVFDWLIGRQAGLLEPQKPGSLYPIPSGVPEWLLLRESELFSEQRFERTQLLAKVALLESRTVPQGVDTDLDVLKQRYRTMVAEMGHMLDELDAKLEAANKLIESAPDSPSIPDNPSIEEQVRAVLKRYGFRVPEEQQGGDADSGEGTDSQDRPE